MIEVVPISFIDLLLQLAKADSMEVTRQCNATQVGQFYIRSHQAGTTATLIQPV